MKYLITTVLVFGGHHLQQAVAQTSQNSEFAQISAYSRNIDALNERRAAQLAAKATLLQERDAIKKAIADSETDLQAVTARAIVNQLMQFGNQIEFASSTQDLNRINSPAAEQQALAEGESARLYGIQRDFVALSRTLLAANSVSIEGQRFQLDAASRSIADRRQKLLTSAQDLSLRAQKWIYDERKLFDQYLELADMAGTRSRLELRAALRVLEQAAPENSGAHLAKAITLLRLDRPREAAKLLEYLSQSTAIRPFALAVHGELLARQGDVTGANKSLKEAARLAPASSSICWFQAQSSAIMNQPEAAIAEWQTLLKSGQHEIAAHRGLALACCAVSPANVRNQKLAMEHAKLAHSLSGEKDWSCQIALALATARDGDLPQAARLAEAAAENAIAERKQQCLEIAAQLKAGQIPAWKF